MQYLWVVWPMLKLIAIVLWWLLLCITMLWIPIWLLRYKVNVMFNIEIDYKHVRWLLLCFKWIYCLLVLLLRYEWMMKFYCCLWMPKTERVWTPTLSSVACDLYFCNILIFTYMSFDMSPRVSDPRKIGVVMVIFHL